MMKTRMLQVLSVMMVLGLVLSACQPQVVEVEKEVVVTQVVREEVEVEKVVEVEVEKVVEVEKAAEDALGFVDIAPGEPVHIAYMLATSGAVEFLGADSLGGIEIAIEEYGQLHGHDILLTGEDSLCSAEGGQTAAVKVAADPTILGVLGTNCSSAGTAASVVISEAGMVMISPTNTSPALTDPNETWNPGYYRTAHNDKFQGAVAAEFAYNELGARTAAALHDGDPYTEGLASVFAEVFAEIGGTVTSFEAVNKGDTDMRPVLTTIAAGEPEVLYFPIFEPEGNFVGAQSQEVPGLENVTLMGADGLLVKSFGPNTGPAAVGMYLSGPYISDDISAYASFLAKYEANTGGPPPAGFAAHAYDGANILLASIAKAAIVDDDGTLHVGRQALRDAVGSTYRYGGLTGILSCDEYGDCATGEALAVFQLSADNVASEDNWPPEVVYTPTGGTQIVEEGEDVTLRVMVMGNNRVEDFATNEFTMYREQQTGVHIEWEVVPVGAGPERLALTLASGELPDIFLQMSILPATQAVYGAQGFFLPLNNLIAQYGEHTKAMFETSPQIEPLITTPEGIIYGLPKHNECFHCYYSQKAWINIKWLDALGLDMPTTTEEFVDVLTAFKDQDPNGNGVADEIPLVGATKGWNTNLDGFLMQPFIYSEQFNHRYLILEDGVIDDAVTQDGWREGLRYLNRLFEAGLFGEESFTQGNKDVRVLTENPDANLVGVGIAGAMGAISQMNSELGRWLEYRPLAPLEGPSGRRETIYNPYSTKHGECVISATSEHTVEAFRWCDGMLSLDNTMRAILGRPGIDWKWSDEGETSISGGQAVWTRVLSFGDVQNYHWAQTGPSYRSFEFRSAESAHDPEENSEVILWNESIEKMQPYARDIGQILPPLTFSEAASAEYVDLDLAIVDYVKEMEAAFALGAEDIDDDAAWAEYVATLEGMDIDRYVELHQEAYDQQWKGKH